MELEGFSKYTNGNRIYDAFLFTLIQDHTIHLETKQWFDLV